VIALFSVRLGNKAEKQLEGLDGKMRIRAEGLFVILMDNPVPAKEYDLRKIKGEIGSYRIRLSGFRVTYEVFWMEKIVRIAKIELHSETTYD